MPQRRDIGRAVEGPPMAAGGTSCPETPRNLYLAPNCSRGILYCGGAASRTRPEPPTHGRAAMHHPRPPLCILHAAGKRKTSLAFWSLFVSDTEAAEARSGFFPALVWSPHTTTQRGALKRVGKFRKKHRRVSSPVLHKGSRVTEEKRCWKRIAELSSNLLAVFIFTDV